MMSHASSEQLKAIIQHFTFNPDVSILFTIKQGINYLPSGNVTDYNSVYVARQRNKTSFDLRLRWFIQTLSKSHNKFFQLDIDE